MWFKITSAKLAHPFAKSQRNHPKNILRSIIYLPLNDPKVLNVPNDLSDPNDLIKGAPQKALRLARRAKGDILSVWGRCQLFWHVICYSIAKQTKILTN